MSLLLFWQEAAGGVTVTPGTAALALTAFTPTVSTPRLVTPSTAALSLSAFAPTVTATDHKTVTPGTASLSLTAFAPTVTGGSGVTVIPGTASLTTSLFAPTVTVSDNKTVTPSTVALSTSTFAPTVTATDNQVVTPGTASLSLTMFAPAVTATDYVAESPYVGGGGGGNKSKKKKRTVAIFDDDYDEPRVKRVVQNITPNIVKPKADDVTLQIKAAVAQRQRLVAEIGRLRKVEQLTIVGIAKIAELRHSRSLLDAEIESLRKRKRVMRELAEQEEEDFRAIVFIVSDLYH